METVQRDKRASRTFQGIAQSDEDDIEDEYDARSGGAPGDTINNGNDCSDETETSWLVLHMRPFHMICSMSIAFIEYYSSMFATLHSEC